MLRLLKRLFAVLLAAVLLSGAWFAWYVHHPLRLPGDRLDFNIDPGMGLRQVSKRLADAGLTMPPWLFTLLARSMGRASDIKAGSYEVEAGVTPLQLLAKITRGDTSQGELLLVEGWNLRQLRDALDDDEDVRHDSQGLSNTQLLAKLGVSDGRLEGMFYPDTYLFPKGGSDLDVLRRARQAMDRQLQAEWQARASGLPYASPYEALIMASLVEKETGKASDRPLVASVFINRLAQGMPLQTDPTVIYGMGAAYEGKLKKQDLQRDTPYNTYTRGGLPPTPIAMPGRASLQAALHPAKTDFLYFVARGDGSSEFSRNLDAHNRAVNKYIRRKGN